MRTIIVGGGGIGLALAWELARRGVSVTLLEQSTLGKATSWAAAGILPPANKQTATDPGDQLRGLSHSLYPQWCQRLQAETGIDCGLRRCGGWYLAETPGERAAMLGQTQFWQDLQIECQRIELSDVAAREPALGSWTQIDAEPASDQNATRAAWWTPDEYQIRTPRFLQALAKACRLSGVELHENSPVHEIRSPGQGCGVRVGQRWIDADAVVLCAGAWTGLIDHQLRLENSLIPIRGQILLLKIPQPLFQTVINVGHRYLIGREDGHVLVGSCEEEVGLQLGTTDSMLFELRQFANRLCPVLESAESVTAWSGLRPMTFDGFPMIGRVPSCNQVFVAAGHFRSGIHLAPGTAVALADTLLGETPPIDLESFRVGKQQANLIQHSNS